MDSKEKVPRGWIKVQSKTRADKFYYYNKEKKISVWKLSDCNDESKIQLPKSSSQSKTPKKSPKKESKLSNHSIVIGKRNLAEERLKKLQTTLKEEAKRGKVDKNKSKPNKRQGPVENNTIISRPSKSLISSEEVDAIISGIAVKPKVKDPVKNDSKSQEITLKAGENDINNSNTTVIDDDESFKMEVDEQLDKSTESLTDYEEPMEWEDIDEKLVVKEVQNIRTKINATSNSSIGTSQVSNKLSKTDFYIIVDTNVLLSNLTFVKEIKSKLFKDIGRAYIYLPYIVLCELDRLKLREESIARLARTAISFIDDCFKAKDEFILGQNAIESSRELIEIDSGDDYIINCALQMKELTSKIILLSNDKNLRNKGFVNGFDAFSSDTLNYADYNVNNTIKFE
ncbi:hypothetical protein ACKWTF_006865 [Chironomus riparius]